MKPDRTEEDIREAFEKSHSANEIFEYSDEINEYVATKVGWSNFNPALEKLNCEWKGYKTGAQSQQEKIEELEKSYEVKYEFFKKVYREERRENLKKLSEKDKQIEELEKEEIENTKKICHLQQKILKQLNELSEKDKR